MDTELKVILSFVGIAAAVVLFYAFLGLVVLKRRRNAKAAIRARLLNRYNLDGIYLCYRAEDVGNHEIQFDGEPHGTLVRPGMTITDPTGVAHTITEVYNADRTNDPNLDIPEAELKNGELNTAIVISATTFHWEEFRAELRRGGGYVAMKVQ